MSGADGVDLAEAVLALVQQGGTTIVRQGRPTTGEVTSVLLQVPGDPAPESGAVVLWADPDGEPPDVRIVVVRASAIGAATRLPATTTVLSVPDDERWTDVLQRLRHCVLASVGGDDLFDLADALASAVGGAVAIEDVDRAILAFSTIAGQPIDEVRRRGILGRRVPEHVERDQWYARLWQSDAPVHFTAGPESSPRLALGLRAGGERVGSVWVVGNRTTLAAGCEDTLVASASGLAGAVVATTGTSSRSREQRARALARVLAEPAGPELDALLPAVLVGLTYAGGGDLDDLVRARLVDVLGLQSQRRDDSGLAGLIDGSVYAVLPLTTEDRLQRSLRSVLQRVGLDGVSAVVSEPVLPGASFRRAHAQVASLMSLPTTTSDSEDVRFVARRRQLVQLVGVAEALAERDDLSGGIASLVDAHDAGHGTSYIESLLAWLDANGDVARAAARLHVHANTLRYRVNRAVQLFELDLETGDARLLLHLELRLRALGYGAAEPPAV